MTYKNVDAGVLGYLGRALSMEMSAVQQYLTLSRLLRLRGYDDMATHFHQEANEELAHSDRIIGRMLVLGVAPNMTQLRAARLGESLPELMASAEALERDIVNLYQQAVVHCQRINDFDNHLFFDQLLQEEQRHVGELANWQNRFFERKPDSH